MKPKHPRSRRFLDSGIFDSLSNFSELEQRIKDLPETEGGDAFEVFAEAYLATQKICQAKEIWPEKVLPPRLIVKFNLGNRKGVGIDGIYQTNSGAWCAYQVKFRSKQNLTWTEISSFFGRTEQFHQRVVITPCNRFATEIENAPNTTIIRGNDFARLDEDDFDAIHQWLEEVTVKIEPKWRDPHQFEALEVITPALQKHDRVTAVMACGTGKTLVTLWAAEESGAKSVLVLVPSLALIRQTLHEWLAQTAWKSVAYLCVCSDPSVRRGADNLVLRPSDLDFPVQTDSENVAKFLAAPFDGIKLVFSTYKSAKVVAKGMDENFSFDLGVFDEAHNTAGKEGKKNSFALDEANLAIRKRLFVTATPRHYSPRKRKKGDEAAKLFSMDDPKVYGPLDCRYELSFAKAARDKIICDYKVIIPEITNEEVTNELLSRGEVLVEGDIVRAQQVANQLAIKQAIEKDGVKKIISFHPLVDSAKSFTSEDSEGIKSVIPDLWAGHVNGKMKTVNRESIMAEFDAATTGIVSNAGCLTEGVDVPAVDMVAFTSPKRSVIDIVQATGRAVRKVRKDPSKTIGYIFIPLYVERAIGETIEQAIKRLGFEELANVLNAMKEQDEVLIDILREMQEERGRTGGYDDSRFRAKVEIRGESTTQDVLRDAITTLTLDRLGTSWDYYFGKLKAYKKQNGDCLVPAKYESDPIFGHWANNQRSFFKRGQLSSNRVERLDSIKFEWDVTEAIWEIRYHQLEEFYNENGHSDVPTEWPKNRKLSHWVFHQRSFRKRGKLSQDQIDRLDKLKFCWDVADAHWNKYFRKLAKGEVVSEWWKEHQRKAWRERNLPQDRIELLKSVGFSLDPHPDAWSNNLKALQDFHAEFGHWNVPEESNKELWGWVRRQREAYKNEKLSQDRIDRLDAIGFDWRNLYEQKWDEQFEALVAFKKKYGHCDVPGGFKDDPALGSWVSEQRRMHRRGKLTDDRRERLKKLGFNFDVD